MESKYAIKLTLYGESEAYYLIEDAKELWSLLPDHLVPIVIKFVDKVIESKQLEGVHSLSTDDIYIGNLVKLDFFKLQSSYYQDFANNVVQLNIPKSNHSTSLNNTTTNVINIIEGKKAVERKRQIKKFQKRL